jgi:hypothetical protein
MKRTVFAALALSLALLAAACSVDPGEDRAGTVATGIAVDSVRFLPFGSRFILRDSAVPIAFVGYHAGYACSRFLELGLKDEPEGNPPAFRPSTRVRLPGDDECALDSGARDTSAFHVFREGDSIRLATPAGIVTDTAKLVAGRPDSNSIQGVPDSNRTFTVGKLTYRDSTAMGKVLYADSVPACMYLNSAEWAKGAGDTLAIRITWVVLDPESAPGACEGFSHDDTIPVLPRRSLRMAARPAQ